MVGINVDNLDKIIKINNLNYDSLESNINQLSKCIGELEDCYSGNSIRFVFSEPAEQKNNVKKITSVVKNYSDVLIDVKTSYQKQDIEFHDLFSHANL